MELDHLNEFIELASSLNFTETADKLHLAQPTLSKHISTLENDLGAKLLTRSSSRVELTEEGWYFLGVAHNIKSELDRARDILEAMRQRKPIYIDGRFTDPMLSGLISNAVASLPEAGMSIVFNHDHSKPKLELLVDGTIDLLVDIQPVRDLKRLGIERRPLFSRPLVAIVDKNHPLAARGRVCVPDLAEHTLAHLMGEECDPGWDKIVALCKNAGFEPRFKAVPVRSMTEAIVVAPRDCVLIYPGATKELKFLAGARRVALPVEGDGASFGTYAMYRAENEERLTPFLDALTRACAEYTDGE